MGGGSSYFPGSQSEIRELIQRAKERVEDLQFESEVNDLLQNHLARISPRDTEQINSYLEEIEAIIAEQYEVERFLFGGSVAKHTYVDGLSDIDALCILNREDIASESPGQVLQYFYKVLRDNLQSDIVKGVQIGKLAVTVTYQDGTELQLLPAKRAGKEVAISNSTGNSWKYINPKAFQKALTNANQKMNGLLIPTIKFAKSIMDNYPESQRLEGYHAETLALEAASNYKGPLSRKALLIHFFNESARRVLTPIPDITGQSKNVDSYLEAADSPSRRTMSKFLTTIGRRLETAKSIEDWKSLLEG